MIDSIKDSLFTVEDLVILMMGHLHGTARVKEYSLKYKAMQQMKDLQDMSQSLNTGTEYILRAS